MKQVVTIFTKPDCPESQALKDFLARDEVPYLEVDITENGEKKRQLVSATGKNIIPAVTIEQEKLIGKKKQQIFHGFTTNKKQIDNTLKH
ncbi:glutaredoxin family protein [Sediminibacillus massiliensis]|uniref:glutaredoxin family protein n=1 Tax=Sediminibacillus massiliensis TaxID=1926277 RepID=UPI0015C2C984|nr:glutaredoxin [Sediminibacillus massiliensis]